MQVQKDACKTLTQKAALKTLVKLTPVLTS